jgi:hypothetical protein
VTARDPSPAAAGHPPRPGLDYLAAARDVLARTAEAEYPGWQLSHGLYGWTAVRSRDGRTEKCGSLPGIKALMSVAGG